jgi:hypothetical protein
MHGHSHTFRHIASDVKKTNIVEFWITRHETKDFVSTLNENGNFTYSQADEKNSFSDADHGAICWSV